MEKPFCSYVFIRGNFKGQICKNPVGIGDKLCTSHLRSSIAQKQINFKYDNISKLFVLIIGWSDNYLHLPYQIKYSKIFRFFSIVNKFPLEIQSRIANLAYQSKKIFVNTSFLIQHLHLLK